MTATSCVHFFTSHFYSTLREEGVDAISNWTTNKGINVFTKKIIFLPINESLHWSLCAVVNPGSILNYEKIHSQTDVTCAYGMKCQYSSETLPDVKCSKCEKPVHSVTCSRFVSPNSYLCNYCHPFTSDCRLADKTSAHQQLKVRKLANEKVEVPCIIFLDSLKAHQRLIVAGKVRKWLNHEWKKVGGTKDVFTQKSIKLITPKGIEICVLCLPISNFFTTCIDIISHISLSLFLP